MQQSDGTWKNSIAEIKKYFSTEDQPPTPMKDFQEFWETLSEEEKEEFKMSELK